MKCIKNLILFKLIKIWQFLQISPLSQSIGGRFLILTIYCVSFSNASTSAQSFRPNIPQIVGIDVKLGKSVLIPN